MELISHDGIKIRLTRERLDHILFAHPEMKHHLTKIPQTLKRPDVIFEGKHGALIAVRKFMHIDSKNYYFVVVYRQSINDGFIITALKARSIAYLLKREIIWKKP